MKYFAFENYKLVRAGFDRFELYATQTDRFGNPYLKFVTTLDGGATLAGRALTALFDAFQRKEAKEILEATADALELQG